MAHTERIYDATVWFEPSFLSAARHCVRQLHRFGLRAKLVSFGCSDLLATKTRSRSIVLLVPSWWEHNDLLEPHVDVGALFMVLSPRSSPMLVSLLARWFDCSVWDLRDCWTDHSAWFAICKSLMLKGVQQEVNVVAGDSLGRSRIKQRTIKSYDTIAEKFTDYWFDEPPRDVIETFCKLLPRSSRILDAGCGPGHHARFIASAGHTVIGVDLSVGMLSQAKRRVSGVTFERMDIESLSFPPGTFHGIWCAAAVLHLPRENLVQTLQGFKCALRKGGILGLNFQIGRPSELVQRDGDERFFEYYDDSTVPTLFLRSVGFEVLSTHIGETTRNTHEIDMRLTWCTIYARVTGSAVQCAGR